MPDTNWLKQSTSTPIYEDLFWSKPETKSRAGKLLIIGGNSTGFSRPAEAYNQALIAGAGSIKVLLPDKLRTIVESFIEDAVYCPSNKSGSFSKESLAELLDYASWSDMVLLSGDLSHNSETAILFESFISKYSGLLVIDDDAIDLFITNPDAIIKRENTELVISITKLQKLLVKARSVRSLSLSSNLVNTINTLNILSNDYKAAFITKHQGHIVASKKSVTSSTEFKKDKWDVGLSGYIAVWSMQNPTKEFEAITTAVFDYVSRNK